MPTLSYVAILAYVDGIQRVDSVVVPLMEANSDPIILAKQ